MVSGFWAVLLLSSIPSFPWQQAAKPRLYHWLGSLVGRAHYPSFCRHWFDVAVEPTPASPSLAGVNSLGQLLIGDSN